MINLLYGIYCVFKQDANDVEIEFVSNEEEYDVLNGTGNEKFVITY